MQTTSRRPIRKRIRLRDFHYGGGCAYFITIGAFEKRILFGVCENAVVTLNEVGLLASDSWLDTEIVRAGVIVDEFIVMPNHMHAILHLPLACGDGSLFRIVGGFKSEVTSEVRKRLSDDTFAVWQKRFHDRIIRSGRELEQFRDYIRSNPARWCGLDDDAARARQAVPFYKLPI